MGLRVNRWDVLTVFQLSVLVAGWYFLYKRLMDDHVLAPRSRVRPPNEEVRAGEE